MDTSDVYFRHLDRLVARENFLEKEMLDSDVHHLETRTGFFDKLAVLDAGSLAVGISFMTAGYQRTTLESVIHNHLHLLVTALVLVLASLVLCVVHNFLISSAVHLLSKQLECVYHSANKLRKAYPDHLTKDDPRTLQIQADESKAKEFATEKANVVRYAIYAGLSAVITLIVGYCIGLAEITSIIAATKLN